MRLFCLTVFLSSCLLVSASAATPEAPAPQTDKGVRFPHKPHAAAISCNICHKGTSGKTRIDRSMGHGLCLDCHRQQQRGPRECTGCHPKTR